jgi:hypothetical protein
MFCFGGTRKSSSVGLRQARASDSRSCIASRTAYCFRDLRSGPLLSPLILLLFGVDQVIEMSPARHPGAGGRPDCFSGAAILLQ